MTIRKAAGPDAGERGGARRRAAPWVALVVGVAALGGWGSAGARAQSTADFDAAVGPAPAATGMQIYGSSAGSDPVGVGDLLDVRVFGQPQLSGGLRVGPDGRIAPPFIADLEVAGHTAAQIEQQLRTAYSAGVLQHPLVSVRVAESNSRRVAINGVVPRPGMYAFSGHITLLQALALAGGVDPVKASQRVLLLHATSGPTSTAAADAPHPANAATPAGATYRLTTVLETIDLSQVAQHPELNREIAPGDVIDVPEAHRVFISGDIMHPGEAVLLPGLTLAQLISQSGGFLPQADHGHVRVLRLAPGGTARRELIADVGAVQHNRAPDLRLEADDIVIVSGAPMRMVGLQLLDFFSGAERWRVQQSVADVVP